MVIFLRFVHPLLYQFSPPAAVKFAVTDAGPVMVRFCGVVVPDRAPAKPENWYPLLAAALTDITTPLLYQAVAGLMLPPATGLTAVVKAYCVVKLAVYVAGADGAVTEWETAPPSDQFANTYCVPAPPACVAVVAIV